MKWQRARHVSREIKNFIGKEMWVQVERPKRRQDYWEGAISRKEIIINPTYLTNIMADGDGELIAVTATAVELLSPDDPNNVTDDPPMITWEEYSK